MGIPSGSIAYKCLNDWSDETLQRFNSAALVAFCRRLPNRVVRVDQWPSEEMLSFSNGKRPAMIPVSPIIDRPFGLMHKGTDGEFSETWDYRSYANPLPLVQFSLALHYSSLDRPATRLPVADAEFMELLLSDRVADAIAQHSHWRGSRLALYFLIKLNFMYPDSLFESLSAPPMGIREGASPIMVLRHRLEERKVVGWCFDVLQVPADRSSCKEFIVSMEHSLVSYLGSGAIDQIGHDLGIPFSFNYG